MQAIHLKVEPEKAKELLRQYREHRAAATPDDEAIMRAYREIARGRMIVQAYESIRRAGFNDQGLPRLAIVRACFTDCWYSSGNNQVRFSGDRWGQYKYQREAFDWTLPNFAVGKSARAIVPSIPLHLRPKHNLRNYHILWESEWKEVPRDPYLLRRLAGDLWLVVAAWDLTDVERAVLATRVHGS